MSSVAGNIIKLSQFEDQYSIGLHPIPIEWDEASMTAKRHPEHKSDIRSGNGKPNLGDIVRWYGVIGNVNGMAQALYPPRFALDFDLKNTPDKTIFDQWFRAVEATAPGALRKICVEKTRSGGFKVYGEYSGVSTKQMLAQSEDGKEVIALMTGGLLSYSSPTPGYELVHNDFSDIEELTPDEFDILISTAIHFNKYLPREGDYLPGVRTEYPRKYEAILRGFDVKCTDELFDKLLASIDLFPTGKRPKVYSGKEYSLYLRQGSNAAYSAKVCFNPKTALFFSSSYAGFPSYHTRQNESDKSWVLTPSLLIYYIYKADWQKTAEVIQELCSEFDIRVNIPGVTHISHEQILSELKGQCKKIDFAEKAFPKSKETKDRLNQLRVKLEATPDCEETLKEIKSLEATLKGYKVKVKHYTITTIEEILRIAEVNKWGMCINCDFVYLYNGAFWRAIEKEGLQKFFGEVAELIGVPSFDARHYPFREGLLKQFYATAHLPRPPKTKDTVLMNFRNGTLVLTNGELKLREFNPGDFLTYQLPFEYDPNAGCPEWDKFLTKVLPEKSKQQVLAEFFASAFINNKILKLEKVLMLFGTGANGKGVVFEVISAMFGADNISNYSLQNLTDENGYYRAMIVNKLLNYSSENGVKVDPNHFKALASGEDVPARLPYGQPFQASGYAKLVFNTNRLPKDGVEQTDAFFRRFLIVPFDVTIPEDEQDRELHTKIIETELPGIFNWVIAGLHRLLDQRGFTHCDAIKQKLNEYRTQSDSVRSFLEDEGYEKHPGGTIPLQVVYDEYKASCVNSGLRPVSVKEFSIRLREAGYEIKKAMTGRVVFIRKADL